MCAPGLEEPECEEGPRQELDKALRVLVATDHMQSFALPARVRSLAVGGERGGTSAMLKELSHRYPEKTFYLGQVFSDTTTSYKFVWFLALLSQLRRTKQGDIPLADLLSEMATIAWHPVCFFRLSLGLRDKLQRVVLNIRGHSFLPPDAEPEAIRKFVAGFAQVQEL
jgi:hypothetical protein